MRTRKSSSSGDGFTLIEVTIAMTLLALMTVILYGAFYVSHRAVDKAQARFDENQRLRSVGEFLGGYIRSTYPYRLSPRDPAIYFYGEDSRLSFVSALSVGMGGRGMSRVTVFLDSDREKAGFLTLEEESPVRVEAQGDDAGYRNRLVLSQGVSSFRIDYLDPQSAEERWLDQWDGKERKLLPRAIRLNLRSGRGEETQWVFPIMISVLAP